MCKSLFARAYLSPHKADSCTAELTLPGSDLFTFTVSRALRRNFLHGSEGRGSTGPVAGSGAHPGGAGAHTRASSTGRAAGLAAAPPTSRPVPVTHRTSSPRRGSPAAAAECPQLCPSSEPTDLGPCVHPRAPQRSLRAGARPSASGPELVINRRPVSSAGPVQHGTGVRALPNS